MDYRPNVLFLVVDSLRYDVVFGEAECETPALDELAERGVRFDTCIAQGISTAPSMTAMHTGRYPLSYGGHWSLDDDQSTFSEVLGANGYSTAAIHSNPNVSEMRNFDKGFDTFEAHVVPIESTLVSSVLSDEAFRYANKLVRVLSRTPYRPAEQINQELTDWIEQASQPWFLWTQYMDVHGPYLPGDDFTYRNKLRAERLWQKAAVRAPEDVTSEEHEELWHNYRLEVEYLDRYIGRFIDDLESMGELAETMVVVVGDHGDEFREHGQYGHSNHPYDELIHVPLIVLFPDDSIEVGFERTDKLVRCVDLLPTALDLGNCTLPEEMRARTEGRSLLTIQNEDETRVSVTEKHYQDDDFVRIGIRTDRWKYLFDGRTGERMLFDLAADPGEATDVTGTEPAVTEQFEDQLRDRLDHISRTSERIDGADVETSPGVEERLRALGYRE